MVLLDAASMIAPSTAFAHPRTSHDPRPVPAARAQEPWRTRNFRHPRRLHPAAVQADRGERHPAARHAQPRARPGFCRRRGGAHAWRHRRGGRHLWRGRAQHRQRRGQRLCRARAAGGPGRLPGRGGGAFGPAAAPPGAARRFAVAHFWRDHLRPRAPVRPADRAGRAGARAAPLPRAVAAGADRGAARHDAGAHGRGAGAARQCLQRRGGGRMRRRVDGAHSGRAAPGAGAGRGDSPLRHRGARGRAGAPPAAAGAHHLHGPRPVDRCRHGRGCSTARHLPGRGG